MRILVDTHIFIWHLEVDQQLSLDHRQLIGNPANQVHISVASLWDRNQNQPRQAFAFKAVHGHRSRDRPVDQHCSEHRAETYDSSLSVTISSQRSV